MLSQFPGAVAIMRRPDGNRLPQREPEERQELLRRGSDEKLTGGCSNALFGKAAASEKTRRTQFGTLSL